MQKVEPIRDKQLLNAIMNYLDRRASRNRERDALLFALGVETGPRISDLLKLRVYDIKNKRVLKYKSHKNNKSIEIPISKQLQQRIKTYCKDKEPYEYLFATRQSDVMTRQNASRIMNEIKEEFQLDYFNTHSFRKTFAHMLYTKFEDIALVQLALGHDSPVTTMKYLGIEQDYLNRKMAGYSTFS